MTADIETARRRFTRAEYYRMADVGILEPADRVELIRGEIVEMSSRGRGDVAALRPLGQAAALCGGADPEYWIVDGATESVEIFRTPDGPTYRDVTRVADAGAAISPETFPDVTLTLAEVLA